MAIQQDNVNVNEEALEHLSSFSGPIPGQSLTTSPDNPQPYERPPSYTTLEEASYSIFEMLTEDEMFNLSSDEIQTIGIRIAEEINKKK